MRQPVARLEGNQAISHSNHGQAERREVRNGLRPRVVGGNDVVAMRCFSDGWNGVPIVAFDW